ncbi:MAG: hypothetical protein E7F81_04770 [Cutibacterium avidum]|nr:hypothetical protein [Cutibacterium avidum]
MTPGCARRRHMCPRRWLAGSLPLCTSLRDPKARLGRLALPVLLVVLAVSAPPVGLALRDPLVDLVLLVLRGFPARLAALGVPESPEKPALRGCLVLLDPLAALAVSAHRVWRVSLVLPVLLARPALLGVPALRGCPVAA